MSGMGHLVFFVGQITKDTMDQLWMPWDAYSGMAVLTLSTVMVELELEHVDTTGRMLLFVQPLGKLLQSHFILHIPRAIIAID